MKEYITMSCHLISSPTMIAAASVLFLAALGAIVVSIAM